MVSNSQMNSSLPESTLLIDPIWERKYASGHVQSYPWDQVVSFIFRYAPKDVPRKEICVLEVGCGSGANLWFAAREGFKVTGIEGSETAIKNAKKRFLKENLEGEFHVRDFTNLPFTNEVFDLVIDRDSLCCVGIRAQKKAISEIHRCLKEDGVFLHSTYTTNHSSILDSEEGKDSLSINIKKGSLVGFGQIYFSSVTDIHDKFKDGWRINEMEKRERTNVLIGNESVHSEWYVVAKKIKAGQERG